MPDFNDDPIRRPDEDRFNFNSFAQMVAKRIQGIEEPKGSVIAIYGAWGSGKSSAMNLVRHYLPKSGDLVVVEFPVWKYQNKKAISSGFFETIYYQIKPEISIFGKIEKISSRFKKWMWVAKVPLIGKWISGFIVRAQIGGVLIELESKVANRGPAGIDGDMDRLHRELDRLLQNADKRFLIIADDMDRLTEEEALAVFRLVRSVGRLHNVIYLLAYDRKAVEEAVAKTLPSSDPRYLEKIVQFGFDLPRATYRQLELLFQKLCTELAVDVPDLLKVPTEEMTSGYIMYELRTPRDIKRLSNVLFSTLPPLASRVFIEDFVRLEVLRLFRPNLYWAIHQYQTEILSAEKIDDDIERERRANEFDAMLLSDCSIEDRKRSRLVLMHLFPQLGSVWFNKGGIPQQVAEQRKRVCSRFYFDTYFEGQAHNTGTGE